MKKEVSEHLSRAFFEIKKKKKKTIYTPFFWIVTICSVVGFSFCLIWWGRVERRPLFEQGQDLVLEKHDGPYSLNFDFTSSPTKIQVLSIDLGSMDIHRYESLTFSIRIPDGATRQANSIKVSLVNKRKETSSLYISEINNSWKKVTLLFSNFIGIHDWTCVDHISFSMEEWNVLPKKGDLLIDNIGFSKKRPNVF